LTTLHRTRQIVDRIDGFKAPTTKQFAMIVSEHTPGSNC
jgi:hypothetical protein